MSDHPHLPLGPRGDPIEVLREIEEPILMCEPREYRWVGVESYTVWAPRALYALIAYGARAAQVSLAERVWTILRQRRPVQPGFEHQTKYWP
jgi:hypothetical protein